MVPKEPKQRGLTPSEKEVLRLISEEFLTLDQIATRRQTGKHAIWKILRSLKKKGVLNNGSQKVNYFEAPTVNHQKYASNYIRLHGQEFNIKIIFQNPSYQTRLEKSNLLFIDGHTIKLYRNSIEVYSGEGTSFYAETANEALSKSLNYWKKFFVRLENELNLILVKPRASNIRLVNQHFARGNSEIYENAKENKERIRIFAHEDGKLAFITDDSFGFGEDETVHPKTAKPDREEIDKQVNDWRLNHPPTNSQLTAHIFQVSANVESYAKETSNYAQHIKSHVESVQQLGSSVTELTQIIKELKEVFKK